MDRIVALGDREEAQHCTAWVSTLSGALSGRARLRQSEAGIKGKK